MSNTKVRFRVLTQDVDGTDSRYYKTLAAAAKRFAAMVGRSVQESYDFLQGEMRETPPDRLYYLRSVSNYGTVVVIRALDDDGAVELARLAAPRPTKPSELSDADLLEAERRLYDSIDYDQRLGDGEPTPKAMLDEYNALNAECCARNLPGFKPLPFDFPTTEHNPTNASFADGDLPF